MKTTALLLALQGIFLASLSAQTVPGFLNYQGRVTDSTGAGLGTPTPENRKIVFRIYDAASAGNLLWTEEQTVTVGNGVFSVLLGQGIPFSTEPRPTLDTVFAGATSTRFLGITVDNGDGTINGSDAEVSPRQQITSTAFAFRAATADSIATGSNLVLNNSADYGLGYYGAGRPFGGIDVDGPVLFGLGGGALGSANGATQEIALNWNDDGNVGIGVTSPTEKLDIAGNLKVSGSILMPTYLSRLEGSNGYVGFEDLGGGQGGMTVSNTGSMNLVIDSDNNNTDRSLHILSNGANRGSAGVATLMSILENGNVGIGDSDPTEARLVVRGNGSYTSSVNNYYFGTGAIQGPYGLGAQNAASILTDKEIHALGFRAFSDSRIKRVLNVSDSSQDLETLLGIEVADYLYIDTIAHSRRVQKKVIAQQVEEVYPEAVSKSTDVVPDVFKKATRDGEWILLETDLAVGERVRLIAESSDEVVEVLEVQPGKFRTAFTSEKEDVFVYGREVKDFRVVDYEAISMLNVSATQELHKQMQAKEGRIAALEEELAELKAKDAAREAKLVAIETLLKSMARPPVQTAALKAAE